MSAGFSHTCGITTSGVAYCWGNNFFGKLGNGTSAGSATPVPVSGGLTFSSVSAGQFHSSCGTTTSGAGYCWGSITGFSPAMLTPQLIPGGLTFRAVSSGNNQSCGVTTTNSAYCWGDNSFGQLGNGTTTASLNPVAVSGGLFFSSVSAGTVSHDISGTGPHSCGITNTGAAYCWGYNGNGGLGNGTFTSSTVPVPVSGGLSFGSIAAGGAFTCGVTTRGEAFCWGLNFPWAQLGNGSTSPTTTNTPGPVADP
jgi:alpha-tubulin suppressor-like RCC1 family protein